MTKVRRQLPSLDREKVEFLVEDAAPEQISLPMQELAFMITNTIYSSPQLLEALNTLVVNWILQSIPKKQITNLLADSNNSEECVRLFINSLEAVVSSLAQTQGVNNG
ncbi:MAG: hypothetical protein K2Q03_00895 [Sphingobacteriaceae bacterium]|nr:hypothetical protein [Sphingobacteriaceae bacterium]